MKFETVNIIELVLSGFALIIFLLFFIAIRKNRDNLFFSMRSSNLMNITNFLLFFSIITYPIGDIFYEELEDSKSRKYIFTFYFIFHLIAFFSLVLRYFRLYLSCKNSSDSLIQNNIFEPKSYHYEYFYVRLVAIFMVLVVTIITLTFFLIDENNTTLFSHEINFIKRDNHINLGNDNYLFWSILYFIETIIYMTFIILIEKTRLNPNVHITLEIFLVSLLNYLYSLSMGFSFFFDENTIKENIYAKDTIILIPLFYNFLIYFVTIALPFLYGVFNTTVIMYDLPGELCSSLYLFLTKEKCYDAFYYYLSNLKKTEDPAKSVYYLDLLINIFKYRLLISNKEENELIRQEIRKIQTKLNDKIGCFDKKIIEEINSNCNEELLKPNNAHIRSNLFDSLAKMLYEFLDLKFEVFQKTQNFIDIRNELIEETNIRCNLTNFGLIRN